MADKDEVEPTDESTPAEPSSVADDPADLAGSDDVETDRVDDGVTEDVDGDELSDDEFDEILRNAGVSETAGDDDDLDGPGGATAIGEADGDHTKVLEPAGVGAAAAGGAAKKARVARSSKDTPTSKRDQVVKPERTTPPKFVKQSIGELRKVVYPTGQQLINYFVVVLVFVLFIIAYVSGLDLGLGALIFKIFT